MKTFNHLILNKKPMNIVKKLLIAIVSVTFIMSCSKIQINKDVIKESIVAYKVTPVYPREALINRIEGSIEVEFTITKDSEAKDFVIISSSPTGIFDKEMIKAIKVSLFKPKSVNGVNVDSRTMMKHIFKFEH